MEPLVSILIPAYNAEEWLGDSIRSALAQTWPRKEIVVVDDGSTDQTLRCAEQFRSKTVLIVTQQNQGAAAARNKALSLCQGDYIQWLDADDLLSHNKIAAQMAFATQEQTGQVLFSSSWGYFMYRPGKAKFTESSLCTDLSPIEWLLRKWEHNAHMQTATWLASREVTMSAGPWNTQLLGDDDGEYFFRVIKRSRAIRFVPEAKVFYRAAGSNRLSYIARSEEKIRAQFLGMRLQIGYLREMKDDERVRRACVTYLQTWFHNFYPNHPDIVAQAEELARSLGGQLRVPGFSWKYAWIEKLFGWTAAQRAQIHYNLWKTALLRSWDRAWYLLNKNNRLAPL